MASATTPKPDDRDAVATKGNSPDTGSPVEARAEFFEALQEARDKLEKPAPPLQEELFPAATSSLSDTASLDSAVGADSVSKALAGAPHPASAPVNAGSIGAVAARAVSASAAPVVRIEPPSGWMDLRLGEVWEYRELLYFFVWRDLKVRYKQTVIGVAWVILQPLLTMGVFTIFFGRLAKLPSQGLPYPVFYFAALVPWSYFSQALASCTNVVVDNQNVITKVYFPRLVLPLAAVCSGLVDFAIGFVVMVALTLGYGFRPGAPALLLPLFILLAVATALGVGLWTAALNALYRDVRAIIPFLIQFWMLASPVAYPSSLVPERWRWLYGLNPMAGVIEGFRWALTGHGQAPGPLLAASTGMVAVVLLGGLLFFQRIEGTVADRV